MDFKSIAIAWVQNICQEFGTSCMEVDHALCQQGQIRYVENQLLKAGTNVKQFYSEFVQDVLPSILVDSMKEEAPDVSASDRPDTVVYEDHKPKLCNVNSLSRESFGEAVEELYIDSSSQQNVQVCIYEKLNTGDKENHAEEKKFPSEIPEVVTPAEDHLSMASLFCGSDRQVKLSTPISLEFKECNCSMKDSNTSNLVDVRVDILSALPSANSVIFAESCELKFPDSGVTFSDNASSSAANDAPAVNMIASMTESSSPAFDLCNVFAEFEDIVSLADSDDASVEEAMDDHCIEPGMGTTQPFNKLKLDESCVLVDTYEILSVSDSEAEHHSYQDNNQEVFASKTKSTKEQGFEEQATCCGDMDAAPNPLREESSTPTLPMAEFSSSDHDFCESDWEII